MPSQSNVTESNAPKTKYMKKLLLTLFFLLPAVVWCQDSLYHRIGDTIEGRSPIYYYDWWYDEDFFTIDSNRALAPSEWQFSRIAWNYRQYLRYNCVSKGSLKVIGLCVSGVSGFPDIIGIYDYSYYYNYGVFKDTFNVPEYLYLYDATPDSLALKYKIEWIPNDSVRFMKIYGANRRSESCDINHRGFGRLPVHEFYFDSAITVTDSFYVGSSLNSWCSPETDPIHANFWAGWDTLALPDFYQLNDYQTPRDWGCTSFPAFHYKLMDKTSNNWVDAYFPHYLLVMPIIEMDTTPPPPFECRSVSDILLVDSADGGVLLQWTPSEEHTSWEVSYCPSGCDPDSGIVVDVDTSYYSIADFDSCVMYSAYVRARCLNDSMYYSEWSEPVEFSRCDTTSPEPEIVVEPEGGGLTLVPNPTSETLRVISDRVMELITVFDGKGAPVLEIPVAETTATVSVKELPRGIYMVRVVCGDRVITRKLIVN